MKRECRCVLSIVHLVKILIHLLHNVTASIVKCFV